MKVEPEEDYESSEADIPPPEPVHVEGFPDRTWILDNFKGKSAAIRYLFLEHKAEVGDIARHLGLKYRHVFSVVSKAKKATIPEHTCPVCRNRGKK